MTTIVVNDNKMYGDGQMTGQHISSYKTKKIVNLGGAIVGGAGRWASVVKFHQWVHDNLVARVVQEDHPLADVVMPEDMVEEDFTGLVLYQDGTVIQFEGCKNSFEMEQPVAIGSGGDFAISCVHNGLSGDEAIKTAAYFDPFTGGDIQIESFDDFLGNTLPKEKLEGLDKETLIRLISGEVEEEEFDKLFSEEEDVVDQQDEELTGKYFKDVYDDVDYELTIFKDGDICILDYEFTARSFVDVVDSIPEVDLRNLAKLLGVTFPANILPKNLAKKLDKKVKEIIEEMNS